MERCQGYSESRSISLAGVPRSVLRFQHWEQAVEVEVLAPEPDHVHGLYEAARAAREAYLRGCPIGRIVEVVGEVAQRWQDPSDPCRRLAERLLPVTTGFSPPMVSLLLTQVFQRYTPDRLWALLREEVHDPLVLDEFRPRPHFSGQSRAYGPGVITHVLGGSNPALPAVSFIFALLCKSASVAKAPSEEPLFPALFIRSLAAVAPDLAECMLALWWPGGSAPIERAAFAASDMVIVFGNDRTVQAIASLLPSRTQLVAHGHRIALGIVGRDALADEGIEDAARRAAVDVSIGDQLSCLSPQTIYVEEGGTHSARDFAAHLARALESMARQLPPCAVSREAAVALNSFRYTYQFRQYAAPDTTEVFAPPGKQPGWLVVYDRDNALTPTPGYRCVRVCPVRDEDDVLARIAAVQPLVSSVGVCTGESHVLRWAERLGAVGVSRVCPLGSMINPDLGWHHDGWWNLSSFLRWSDIESPC